MSGCPGLGTGGVAAALRQVDCVSAQATAGAFSRLFGAHGMLGLGLTAVLTLYVALLAIGLLTGRTTLRLSMLTPRMLGLGLVLTFATSWVAYQTVIWNLLTGAPDQIATLLTGTRGSATMTFAVELDRLFAIVAAAADAAGRGADAGTSLATPANLLWLSALMLLLGTVGVLVVARIALAALLAVGPIFILLGLFRGTRGLLDGWIATAVLFALVPLFVVLLGGEAIALLLPLTDGLAAAGSEPPMRTAVTLLLAASVYWALMAIAMKAAASITMRWRPTGTFVATSEAVPASAAAPQPAAHAAAPPGTLTLVAPPDAPGSSRIDGVLAAIRPAAGIAQPLAASSGAIATRHAPAILPYAQPAAIWSPDRGYRVREITARRRPSAATPARTIR